MDEIVVSISGEQHWLWRAVDQNGFVLDVQVQRLASRLETPLTHLERSAAPATCVPMIMNAATTPRFLSLMNFCRWTT
jgi:DDE domain